MSGRFHRVLALGVALAAISCSDPVPPAYKAGLRVNLIGTGACPAGNVTRGVGNPPPEAGATAGKGGPIFDGENGVKTSCRVAGGPEFAVQTTIQGNAMTFQFNGSVNQSGTGTATISVYTPELAGNFQSDAGACRVTPVQTAQGFQVKNGAMWATFDCPMVKGSLVTEVCQLKGEVVIENCD